MQTTERPPTGPPAPAPCGVWCSWPWPPCWGSSCSGPSTTPARGSSSRPGRPAARAPADTTAPAASDTTAVPVRPQAEVTLLVANASGVQGAAGRRPSDWRRRLPHGCGRQRARGRSWRPPRSCPPPGSSGGRRAGRGARPAARVGEADDRPAARRPGRGEHPGAAGHRHRRGLAPRPRRRGPAGAVRRAPRRVGGGAGLRRHAVADRGRRRRGAAGRGCGRGARPPGPAPRPGRGDVGPPGRLPRCRCCRPAWCCRACTGWRWCGTASAATCRARAPGGRWWPTWPGSRPTGARTAWWSSPRACRSPSTTAPGPTLAPAVEAWAEAQAARSGLVARPAKMSVELHPPIAADKGTALEALTAGLAAVGYAGRRPGRPAGLRRARPPGGRGRAHAAGGRGQPGGPARAAGAGRPRGRRPGRRPRPAPAPGLAPTTPA